MTLEDLERLKELEKKATKKPWIPCVGSGGSECTGIHSDSAEGVICDFYPGYEFKRDEDKVYFEPPTRSPRTEELSKKH